MPVTRGLIAATWGRGSWAIAVDYERPGITIDVDRDHCNIGPVEGGVARLHVQTSGLAAPLAYKWTASTAIIGKDDQVSVQAQAPPVGTAATVTVQVTTADGDVLTASTSVTSIPSQVADLIRLLCELRKFPNFPIDPLWDPLRGYPLDVLTRPQIRAVHDVAERLLTVTRSLLADHSGEQRRGKQLLG
jgi:hypothetical protein